MALFIRRVSTNARKNSISTLKYLLVLDFEATCWESGTRIDQEIIEFPTLLYDINKKEVKATFHRYVRPVRSPKLSQFCTSLTGIEQVCPDARVPTDKE